MSRKADVTRPNPVQEGAVDFYGAAEKDSDTAFDDMDGEVAVEEDVQDRREVLNT